MILNATSAEKKLRRMALEIAERNEGTSEIILIGIKENGIYIAYKIEKYLRETFSGLVKTISLSLNKKQPDDIILSEPVSIEGKIVLLVDDVANSGKTMLYALKPLLAQHPAQIQTLALVERTHKLFPIAINYVGLSVSTTAEENIVVTVEDGEITGAAIAGNR